MLNKSRKLFLILIPLLIFLLVLQPYFDDVVIRYLVQVLNAFFILLAFTNHKYFSILLEIDVKFIDLNLKITKIKECYGVDLANNRGDPIKVAKELSTSEGEKNLNLEIDSISELLKNLRRELNSAELDAIRALLSSFIPAKINAKTNDANVPPAVRS